MRENTMEKTTDRTIITVVGKDTVGIIAKVCTYLASNSINVLDISQTIVQDFFNMMMENELFDVFGRKNKATGGYMTELPDYGVPFIFANFNGTSGDVDVITHECGHAFQSYVSCKDPITDHSRYLTMETAEIHSMSMEFFAEPWIELFFGERGDDYRKMHLEDAIDFIPYGTMVDEFQHIVYGNPELTPKERRDAGVPPIYGFHWLQVYGRRRLLAETAPHF